METERWCYGADAVSPVTDAVNLIVQAAFVAEKSIHWLLFLILHNIAIAENFQDGFSNPKRFLEALDNLKVFASTGPVEGCKLIRKDKDSFYGGLTAKESECAHEYNFDHPDAFDTEQMLECVEKLKQGNSVHLPIYDFKNHRRCSDSFRQHVLRELLSSPVPASCCTALLEAYRIDRKEARVNAMRAAIFEIFPEPNRRLLQRILKMMHIVSLHTSENRMTPSAVAACMAPLLLRPLLAGECELDDDFDDNRDNSAHLLAAANAANNAQAIVATLLEEFDNIFDDDAMLRCSISAESREISASEDSTDDENIEIKDDDYHDAENESDPETDEDPERIFSGKLSESSGYAGSDLYDFKVPRNISSNEESSRNVEHEERVDKS